MSSFKNVEEKIFSDEIFCALTYFGKITELPYNAELIHTALYRLKEKYQELLKEFLFDTNGTFPFSNLLERILMRGQISGVIEIKNFFAPKTAYNLAVYNKYFEEYIRSKLAKEKIKILEKAGQDYSNLIQKLSAAE